MYVHVHVDIIIIHAYIHVGSIVVIHTTAEEVREHEHVAKHVQCGAWHLFSER